MPAAAARAALGVVLTAILVAVALASTGDRFWPLAPGGMFAFRTSEVVELRLAGHRADGTTVVLDPSAFGLTGPELSVQLQAAAGGHVGFDDRSLVAGLGRTWNDRRPADVMVDVSVIAHRVFLDRPHHQLDAIMLTVALDAAPSGSSS